MWVAYFLPRWISTHEDSSGRTGEKFKSAMRVVGESNSALLPEYQDPAKKRKVIAQRRAIFAGLSALLVGTFAIALLGFIAWMMLLIPTTALAIYFVNVRRQVVASQLKARRLKALEKVTTMPVRISAEYVAAVESSSEHWIPLSDRNELSGVVVIPKDRASWQPISVPRPTYTTAAKAITPKRVIDLTVPGNWSAEQEMINGLSVPSRDGIFDQELEEQAAVENSTSRVVNE
jgi:hypothetical protein